MFALVDGRKTPPAQVAEGQGDQEPASINMQWWITMNTSTVLLVLVEWHKLEQDAATACNLHTCCDRKFQKFAPFTKFTKIIGHKHFVIYDSIVVESLSNYSHTPKSISKAF